MRQLLAVACLAGASATPLVAQVNIGVVQVDASEIGANYITADVFVDVAEESDWWTVGGISGAPVTAGLEHHVIFDPNDGSTITAPGRHPAEREYACFVSLPREQFSNKRFGPSGAAAIAGGYLPLSDTPTYTAQALNIAFLQFPPSMDGSDVPDFGYIARVTLLNSPEVSGVPSENIVVSSTPTGGRLLAEYHVASATREHPAPLSTFTFGFYAVPEPSALALFACAAGALSRRRNN